MRLLTSIELHTYVSAYVLPVDEDSHGNNDDKDEAHHYGNHLMHRNCTWRGEESLLYICICGYLCEDQLQIRP